MNHLSTSVEELINDDYVPSGVERKKAVLMYFFVGIVLALSGEGLSVYESFHLRQSLGRWMLFFLSLLCTSIFIFIWYLWVIPVLLFLFYIGIRCFFVKQAWEGRYTIHDGKMIMPLFFGLGNRVTDVFEFNIESK